VDSSNGFDSSPFPSPPEAQPLRAWRSLGPFAQALLLGLTYYAVARVAHAPAEASANALVSFWPAAGVVTAALVLSPPRRWPALLAGTACGALAFDMPLHAPGLAVALVAANVSGPLLAAAVIRRDCGGTPDIDRVRHTLVLMFGGAVIGPVAGGLIAATAVARDSGTGFSDAWLTYALAHAAGVMAVTPLLVSWSLSRRRPRTTRAWLETAGFVLAAAVATYLTFVTTGAPMLWTALVVVALAGLRGGVPASSAAILPWITISLLATTNGRGAFAAWTQDPRDAVLLVQASTGLGAAVADALGAVAAQLLIAVGRMRSSEERVRLLLEGVHDHAMFMLDEEGRVVVWNAGAQRMLGFAEAAVLGRPLAALFSQAPGFDPAELDLLPDGAEQEHWLRRADGSTFLGTLNAYPVAEPDGTDAYAVVVRDVTDARRSERQLRHMALHDPLTGLPNRALLQDRLTVALGHARREHGKVAVLFCDLDRFKVINDSLGHEAGDEVLRTVAARLKSVVRPGDTVARIGGDEFVFCCEDVDGPEGAVRVAERLHATLDEPLLVGEELFVTASVGIAVGGGATTVDDLLRDADAAMYRAKERGGGHALVEEGDRSRALGRLRGETAIRHALERGELVLHYQPLVEMASGRTLGVEALLRWNHPTRGLLPPGEFIRLAEDTGSIVDIGLWVVEEACRAGHRMREAGAVAELVMNVNVAARQIAEPDFAEAVGAILGRTATNPETLCLELTETTLIEELPANEAMLVGLKRLGIHLAMDDFGTGYSSLAYLRRLPIDVLKLDRSFVCELDDDAGGAPVLRAAVAIAQALSIQVVAEGIERPEQAAVLSGLGYVCGQGYHFARPLPEDQLIAHVRGEREQRRVRRLRVVGGAAS
jgi:diguanylate cyclase (GGDEF)-like protein/PAS domain S-box-containing protein